MTLHVHIIMLGYCFWLVLCMIGTDFPVWDDYDEHKLPFSLIARLHVRVEILVWLYSECSMRYVWNVLYLSLHKCQYWEAIME